MGADSILLFLVLAVGFYMAWNIGANDVSNAMGTSVGSGALTLKHAVILAAFLEFSGAFFLGSKVSETMQKGLVNPEHFIGDPTIFLLGMLSALLATSIWLQIASYFGWPVSTTHAIVGSIIGFGAIIGGVHAVDWKVVSSIALSWVISPVMSAIISYMIFTLLQRKILYAMHPVEATRQLIPYLTFVVIFILTISLFLNGLGGFEINVPLWQSTTIVLFISFLAFIISMYFIRHKKVIPIQENTTALSDKYLAQHFISLNKALKHLQRVHLSSTGNLRTEVSQLLSETERLVESIRGKTAFHRHTSDYHIVEKMFGYLQILSAAFVAFAHGANDVANAIGPVAAVIEIIQQGTLTLQNKMPSWLLAFGGIGIVIGLATWGWRVIETIGRKITELTPTRGFSAEFGAATTILIASKFGFPISTTHCIVGGVLGVGIARGITALNLRMLREIVLSWIVTIPACAVAAIILYYILQSLFNFFSALM
jgi:phosphate/sulfate permease